MCSSTPFKPQHTAHLAAVIVVCPENKSVTADRFSASVSNIMLSGAPRRGRLLLATPAPELAGLLKALSEKTPNCVFCFRHTTTLVVGSTNAEALGARPQQAVAAVAATSFSNIGGIAPLITVLLSAPLLSSSLLSFPQWMRRVWFLLLHFLHYCLP